jgi:uncharacterized protein
MSTISIVGVTGYAGGHIANEALSRGHRVIGVSRTAPTDPPAGLEVRAGSIADTALIESLAAESDVLVIAVHAVADGERLLPPLVPGLLRAAADHNVRLAVVGGAGSLLVAPGGPRLVDAAEFPEAFKDEASTHAEVLELLRDSDSPADWVYLSPAPGFGSYAPGQRTGKFRTGGDVLIEGGSEISGDDFAIAMVDEIERPAHTRARFTVAY